MNGKPKAPFFVVLFLVVAGLVAYAGMRGGFFGENKPKGGDVGGAGDGGAGGRGSGR